jgi:hypothetical protein
MAESTFKTNPFPLKKLLEDCHNGIIKLPEFQRSFVWDEYRIVCPAKAGVFSGRQTHRGKSGLR